MSLGMPEMTKLVHAVQQKIAEELIFANRTDTLDLCLEKYGFKEKNHDYYESVSREPKVLVFGDLGIRKKDLIGLIKSVGLNPDYFEFVDYDDVKNFNFQKLRNNSKYSDIMFGPVPHKTTGNEGYRSIIARIESNPKEYPKMTRITENLGDLKISKSSFLEAIHKTRLLEMRSMLH